jgi:outer membrane protein assembly factor BamB
VLVLALAACSRDVRRSAPSAGGLDTYLLRVRVSGNGEVSVGRLGDRCSDDCTFHIQRGKTVTLTAVGKEDVFHNWSNRCGGDEACKVTMSSNVTVGAEFGLDRYELAWVVPLSATACAYSSGVSVGERVIVAGNIQGTAALGRSNLDTGERTRGLVAALERSTGGIAWATELGDKDFDSASAPEVLSSGEIVAALTESGPGHEEKLVWLDGHTGSLVHSTPVADGVRAIGPVDDGGFIAFAFSPTVTRFGGRSIRWTQKLSASGTLSLDAMTTDERGDVLVVGFVQGIPNFAVPLQGVAPSRGGPKAFLARLEGGTGRVVRARWLDWDRVFKITSMTTRGPTAIATGFQDDRRGMPFYAGLSVGGDALWKHEVEIGEDAWPTSIHSVAASGDSVVVAGETAGAIRFAKRRVGSRNQETAFLAELSPAGEVLWSDAWPMPRGHLTAIDIDPDGDLYVTGTFMEAFHLGGHRIEPVPSNNCMSSFVARFSRTGDRSPGRGL